jgi:hypothetical protein
VLLELQELEVLVLVQPELFLLILQQDIVKLVKIVVFNVIQLEDAFNVYHHINLLQMVDVYVEQVSLQTLMVNALHACQRHARLVETLQYV